MYIWYLLIAFIIIVRLQMGTLDTPKKKKTYLVIVGVATALLLSLRGENYGKVYDMRVYIEFFEQMMTTSWDGVLANSVFEPGFVVLNKLLGYILPFSQGIIVFHGCFCIYCVCRFIYRNTNEVFWGFFFFVTLGTMGFMMTGLRQAIAICICLLSFELIKEKKLVKYLIVVFLAFSIHRTALVFAPAYFICNFKLLQKKPWMNILVVLGIIICAPLLISFGENTFVDFSASDTAVFSLNGIVPILIYSIAIILNIIYKSGNVNRVSNMTLMSTGLGLYLMRFYSMILERTALYYTPTCNVLLADFMGTTSKDKNGNLIRFFVIILCFILFTRRLYNSAWANYIFMWEV